MFVSFFGAADEVTGSCFLLKVKDTQGKDQNLLIDCGMFQGEQMCSSKNMRAFGFDPKTIDVVFVTHPHADHTGRLPVLVKEGFRGTIYMTEPCVGLSKLVLEDAHHIMTEDAEKCGSEVLYELEDLIKTFDQTKGIGYHEQITVAPGVVVSFHDAGHVLGSAYISVDAEGERVVFSGDIGNDNVPILPKTEPISHADYVICESTYGHRVHEDAQTRSQLLREVMESTLKKGGVLLIPAFSIERTQELLYEMNLILRDLKMTEPIYLDSPMAIKATELYRHFKNYLRFDSPILDEPDRDFFSFPNLHETLSVAASKQINEVVGSKIIIAGSGMMSGGRIMHHLKRYLSDPKTTVLVIGYQAEGTLGRKIFGGAKSVSIYGKRIPVRAQIKGIGAFSAHGDQNKLTRWLQPESGIKPKKIFLVHGDKKAKEIFATHLREVIKTDVVIPAFKSTHELKG